jgi:hypothetical protein
MVTNSERRGRLCGRRERNWPGYCKMGFEHLILLLLQTRRGRIVLSLLSIAVCGSIGMFAWPNASEVRRLWGRHQLCMADVINHRYSPGMHYFDGSYDLRYEFRLEPHGPVYRQGEKGPLMRTELWSSLPKDKWEEAVRSGKVCVAYRADDPAINMLEVNVNAEYGAVLIVCIIAAAGLVASLFWLVHLITKPNWNAFDRDRRQLPSASRA